MDSPFGNPVASRPARDRSALATGSSFGDEESAPARLCLHRCDQDTGDGTPEPAISPNGAPVGATSAVPRSRRVFLRANYWRYLEHVTGSETDLLSATEVLEFLLHFGGSAHEAGVIASQLLNRFGSLGATVAAHPIKLKAVLCDDELSIMLLKGVRAAVKAIVREPLEDRPVISSASALMDYLSVTMRHEPTEVVRILFLDHKNGLIKDEVQQRGTVDWTPLYPREVVRRVIELGASAVILVHNHPSGDPTPSQKDIAMTRELAAALNTINVVLHDHIIVGRNQEISLRKARLI